MDTQFFPIYETVDGKIVFVKREKSPPFAFRVMYQSPNYPPRIPKYIHLAIDLYAKMSMDEHLTLDLIDYFIKIVNKALPETTFPPNIIFFNHTNAHRFSPLNNFGEYSVEFLLVIIELMVREKKTKYLDSAKSLKFFHSFRRKADIYTLTKDYW